jgi:NADPH:quinone reductase-like Zn-dependent oxidoreductase
MKAAVLYKAGPPSVLRYEDVADPLIGETDVLVQVQAISIEGGDLLRRRLVQPDAVPHIVGYQAAGVVAAMGKLVTRCKMGDRVAAFHWSGSHAELFAVPESLVYPVPADLDIGVAATMPVTFGTANDALFEYGRLQENETVLIQGGAGGVGLAAIQLAKAAGATVIATSSSDARLEKLRAFGMDHGINYTSADIAKETKRLTDGRGADLIVDLAGGSAVKTLMHSGRPRGRLAVVGASSGELPTFQFMDILTSGITLFGVFTGHEMHLPAMHQRLAVYFAEAAAGTLRMPLDRRFPLSEASAAHAYVEHEHPFGRVLLIP